MQRNHRRHSRRSESPPEENNWQPPSQVAAGIVGTGLMGTSIAACLLIAGHPVAAVEVDAARRRSAAKRVLVLLKGARKEGLSSGAPAKLIQRFTISGDYSVLAKSQIVVEATVEDIEIKRQVIRRVEEVVSSSSIIGSNTSAIP